MIASLVTPSIGLLCLASCSRPAPETPEQVVLKSFESFKAADWKALKSCYTKPAWKLLRPTLIDGTDNKDALQIFRHAVSRLRVEIVRVLHDGTSKVDVMVNIHTPEGVEPDTITLVKSGSKWLIGG